MDRFPTLKSQAIAQYPSDRAIRYRTQVYRYVDGSEQRVRDCSAPVNRWTLRFTALSATEARALVDFHSQQRGRAGTFLFVDPWTGAEHTACFEQDELQINHVGEDKSACELQIREVRD